MKIVLILFVLIFATLPATADLMINFEDYTTDVELAGQNGWYYESGSDSNLVSYVTSPNGWSNTKAVVVGSPTDMVLINLDIADRVATNKILILQYDLKAISYEGQSLQTGVGIVDPDTGSTPGPIAHVWTGNQTEACTWWLDGGGPIAAVNDTNWHTYCWVYDFRDQRILFLTVDGGPPILINKPFHSASAVKAGRLQLKLYPAASGNGQWAFDNFILSTAEVSKIADVKNKADGTPVAISGKKVTAFGGNLGLGIAYIEEPDRASGIRIEGIVGDLIPGETITVIGTIADIYSMGGMFVEKKIEAATVSGSIAGSLLGALGANSKALSGGSFWGGLMTGLYVRAFGNVTLEWQGWDWAYFFRDGGPRLAIIGATTTGFQTFNAIVSVDSYQGVTLIMVP
ncbi:MAG: hypothetical protein HYX78_03490 [Armatimonadetes bacterium]|nr:hypothetical protein [Armatimonadota bacterium]